jgi:hypothetical protein
MKKTEVQVGDVVLYIDRYNDECTGKVIELDRDSAEIHDPRDGHYKIDYDDILKKYNEQELPLYEPEHFMEGDRITFIYEDEVFTGIVTSKTPLSLYVEERTMGEMRVFYEEILTVSDSEEDKEELFMELHRRNQHNWRLYMINVALDRGDKELFLAMTKELQSA